MMRLLRRMRAHSTRAPCTKTASTCLAATVRSVLCRTPACLFGAPDSRVVCSFLADKGGHSNDAYAFNVTSKSWAKVKTTGDAPSARNCHSAVLYKAALFVFGGQSGNSFNVTCFHYQTAKLGEQQQLVDAYACCQQA